MRGQTDGTKYTNATWKKRVDHEAGRHRTVRAPQEPGICRFCGDVYVDRRWTTPEARRKTVRHGGYSPPVMTVCPACKTENAQGPRGFVHLAGSFPANHLEEIKRLLDNEVIRVAEDNPTARIMKWTKDEKGRLMLSTTTEHLAQRLGHALEKAFSGNVRYRFSHENKLAHVYWQRD